MRVQDDFKETTGLPCDLPLHEQGVSADGRPARFVSGLRVPWVLGTVVALLVLAAIALVALNFSVGADRLGPVTSAAAEGVSGLMAAAGQTASDTQGRALRNEGLIAGTVCIDAGHGGGVDLTLTPIGPGSDSMQYVEPGGTSGVATGREEAEVTLEVAQLLAAKLRDMGVNVVMVREDNEQTYSSEARAAVANAAGADIFVRLHCDGSDYSSAQGFSTLIPGYNE